METEPSLMYVNIKEEIKPEINDCCNGEKDPLEITSDDRKIVIKQEYDSYKHDHLLNINMKTEPGNTLYSPNKLKYSEYDEKKFNIDIQDHSLDYSTNNEHSQLIDNSTNNDKLQLTGLVAENLQRINYETENDTSTEDPLEGLRMLLEWRLKEITGQDQICKNVSRSRQYSAADEQLPTFGLLMEKHSESENTSTGQLNKKLAGLGKEKQTTVVPNTQVMCVLDTQDTCVPHTQDTHMPDTMDTYVPDTHTCSETLYIERKVYECGECFRKLSSQEILKNHITTVHKKQINYECQDSGQIFSSFGFLFAHINSDHKEAKFVCEENTEGREITEGNNIEEIGITEENNIEGKITESDTQDTYSGIVYMEKKNYECGECSQKLSSEQSLRNHITTIHNLKIYECPDCHNIFSRFGFLTYHINSVHREAKYFCKECNKKFSSPKCVECHFNSEHRGIYFSCEECNKKYIFLQNLKNHINKIHNNNFMCKECRKIFVSVNMLKYHISSVHKNIKDCSCKYCNRKFWNFTNLKTHMKSIHKDVKSFSCEICDKKFWKSNKLRAHIRREHEREKYFDCEICGNKYAQLKTLRAHVNRVHKYKNNNGYRKY